MAGAPLFATEIAKKAAEEAARRAATSGVMRQDAAAAARAAGGGETALGLLPPEQEQRGVRPEQIMGIVGAVMGDSPAGRGLQAASGMMQQRAQAGQDRIAQQRKQIEAVDRVIMFTRKRAADYWSLPPDSTERQLIRDQYLQIVPGGESLFDSYVEGWRSLGISSIDIVSHSETGRGIFQLAARDPMKLQSELYKNLDKINKEIADSKDQRNLPNLPDAVQRRLDWIIANDTGKYSAFEKCGGTWDCYMQHIDKHLPMGEGTENLRWEVPMSNLSEEAELGRSMADTLRRHGVSAEARPKPTDLRQAE
jgi:hypothetical protein